jgi:hypothetical protein
VRGGGSSRGRGRAEGGAWDGGGTEAYSVVVATETGEVLTYSLGVELGYFH